MKPNRKNPSIKFVDAVIATSDIQTGHQPGLTALGNHSSKIQVQEPSELTGSVDIDSCTEKLYPNSNRWDFMFCYKSKVYFVEVHTANTKEVKTVIKKLTWLKDWLNSSAPEISKLKAPNCFHWIQSNDFKIPAHTSQYRAIIEAGLKPKAKLVLE